MFRNLPQNRKLVILVSFMALLRTHHFPFHVAAVVFSGNKFKINFEIEVAIRMSVDRLFVCFSNKMKILIYIYIFLPVCLVKVADWVFILQCIVSSFVYIFFY